MFSRTESLPPITISVADLMKLETLVTSIQGQPDDAVHYLERELDRAEVLSSASLPKHVVTMHSTVTYRDNKSGELRTVTLVYPREADIARGKISILTPIGVALIGMHKGNAITWYSPNGDASMLEVLDIVQPA